jgi:hypothetical protein
MDQSLLHLFLSGALIAFGLYLFDHPKILGARSRLFRAVVIWAALVIGLKAIDLVLLR